MIINHVIYEEDIAVIADNGTYREKLKDKTVVISGATGQIGGMLVDSLMRMNTQYNTSVKVVAVSRNKEKLQNRFSEYLESPLFQVIVMDVVKGGNLDNVRADFLIHAASNTHPAEYSDDPIGTITANTIGTYNLLEAVRRMNGCRFVMLSSVEIYGENRGDVEAFDESYCGYIDCNTLRAGYPESKRTAEAMVQAYMKQAQVDGTIVRLCRIYGPTTEKDDSKALSQFINKAVRGEDIVLKSKGNQYFSYVYSRDAVMAILHVMLYGKTGEAYNVADTASNIKLKDLANTIAELVGKKVIFDIPSDSEKEGYSKATVAVLNAGKINSLGWKASLKMVDGLQRTIKALQEG